MLSINVAEDWVILVGLVITGSISFARFISNNSIVKLCLCTLRKSIFWSIPTTTSFFSVSERHDFAMLMLHIGIYRGGVGIYIYGQKNQIIISSNGYYCYGPEMVKIYLSNQ